MEENPTSAAAAPEWSIVIVDHRPVLVPANSPLGFDNMKLPAAEAHLVCELYHFASLPGLRSAVQKAKEDIAKMVPKKQ